jgi:hypothetical protein
MTSDKSEFANEAEIRGAVADGVCQA